MGYAAYLQSLLQPLGVYDFSEKLPSGGELAALGEAMDTFYAQAQTLQEESQLLTAQAEGLQLWESLLPYPAKGTDVAERRQRVLGLLNLGWEALTAKALSEAITACGVTCQIREDAESKTAIVSFPGLYGTPGRLEEKKRVIESILPCHLNVHYDIRWITWQETMEKGLTWQKLRNKTFLAWFLAEV